jgi:hypothetical protein
VKKSNESESFTDFIMRRLTANTAVGGSMKNLKELSVNDLKNAIWSMNDGRNPGMGIVASKDEVREELYRRTGDLSGYHESPISPEDWRPDCNTCKTALTCPVCADYSTAYGRYAFGKCPKVQWIEI